MAGPAAIDGMARALLRRGVTSFLPSAVSAPLATLAAFAADVRRVIALHSPDGADILGFNLEGPFLAPSRCGAHEPSALLEPAGVGQDALAPLLDGLRLTTIAPELQGALELIAELRRVGTMVSLGHTAATLDEARAGHRAGATSTTHLFNAMGGFDHRAPGLAVAALTDDDVFVELIPDGHHVDPAVWPIVARSKPIGRVVLVSDAVPVAGTGDGRFRLGTLECEVVAGRVTIAGTTTLAGSVIALDTALAKYVGSGASLPAAVAAISRNPADLVGATDRGRLAPGQRADVVELGDDLAVRRVMRAGEWLAT
jgi:N-acetylglucosamine-6-phosphate deacetylase